MPTNQPDQIEEYVRKLFAPEDAALAAVPPRQESEGLPAIQISAVEGKLIAVLLRMIGARRVLEIGALGGYSGIWIARALQPGGRLTTIEIDPRHAALTRRAFKEAAVADRAEVVEGSARDLLPGFTERFDAIFVDADKESYPFYFPHVVRLLRPGGILLGDNALRRGWVADPQNREEQTEAMREFNRLAATDPRLSSIIIPVRDGLLLGVKLAD